MATGLKPIRRVVTGDDARGKSRVVWDGPAPNAHPAPVGTRGHTDLWVWYDTPAPLSGDRDDGNLPYDFPGSANGGHLRVIQSGGRPAHYDPAKDPEAAPAHAPKDLPSRRTWDRGGNNAYSSAMHKTETVDYGIMLAGERELILDDRTLVMRPGDIVVQVGAWHQWSSPRLGCQMAFDMIAARFVDGPVGLAQGRDAVMRAGGLELPEGVKPARRIVTIDKEPGRSTLVSDGPAPDVRTDPARPGFASARLWVTDSLPAKIVLETLHLPHAIEPPARGSVCRVVTFPPDETWKGKVGAAEVQAFFRAMGSPAASTYSPSAPHPYMQKTRTLDFCIVLEGEIALMLDMREVPLKAGEIVVQRGTNHAWSNRSSRPAVVMIASHDGA
ncbi:MAG: cupin domain-containing protein [Nitrospinota bacterium]